MAVDETMLVTIEAIYDAALEPSRWPDALNSLAGLFRSQAATFWVLGGGKTPQLNKFTYINFDSAFIREYMDGMALKDPTVQYLLSHPDASIIHDGQYLNEREIDNHPYYDWHLRHTDTRYRLLGKISPGPGLQAGVALHRTRKSGRYEPFDLALFNCVYPHLQRSLMIAFRMGTLDAGYQAMADLLNREHVAMLFLDARGHMIHHNAKLEVVTQADDGIRLDSDGLVLADPGCDQHLNHMIAMALPKRASRRHGGVMQVARPSGRRPYQVSVTPVPESKAELSISPPVLCITISDPADDYADALSCVKTTFGLTSAEGRLACLLASGEELSLAAKRLGIQYETARTRLADIFRKTQTHRQGELVSLLLSAIKML
ncbi:hypothetical protein BI364_06810 [Acidihalobacter yilgarnensis]|uniref:HTH luxR-type domain-containing protein n=1 Tax=Acidihalobacter yilgarnensis TaxID=2819280 RepID=A0A1D8IML4_9GAMM|nr:helix-turn-helix transcriptional regulator [Acidihalobacter yilgarnensis]AOU97708.1 hypothetical protein BI364_06810 [Acidihalobacter yilgarnensis]